MLDCLNEHRSRSVKAFPMTEWLCEGAKGNSGNNFIENPEDASSFIMHLQKNQLLRISWNFCFQQCCCVEKSP